MKNITNSTILFVDDEEKARKYFERAYSKDFNILTAHNVEDAKNVLEKHSDEIGVLITDQRMPGDYGVVLLNYTKEKYPHIVRLLTTAFSDLEEAIEAVNSGEILRYIVKPWDIKALHLELKNALSFFYIQHERDQLISEKLSVWQRMTEINRVRDLLIMAGSFSHLNNSISGTRSLLLQSRVTVDRFSEEHSLEMWGLLEYEVTEMLTLADDIKTATQITDRRFLKTSIASLLSEITNGETDAVNFQITTSKDWPHPNVCPELLAQLFKSLGNYFETAIDDPTLNIIITGDGNDDFLVLNLKPKHNTKVDAFPFHFNKDLLIAFLIAAHHNGEIVLNKENQVSVDLRLPLGNHEPSTISDEDYWLDEILSLYET